MGILVAILGLGLIIFIHELGHFTAGKILRLKITEFFLGLPVGSALIKFKRGETEYGIKPVLFGGYVKFPEFLSLTDTTVEKAPENGPAHRAGIRPGDSFSAIDERPMENWNDIAAAVAAQAGKTVNVRLRREDQEITLPVNLGEKNGRGLLGAGPAATDEITIDDLPDTLDGQSLSKKTFVTAAGPLMNIALAIALLAGALMIGFAEPTNTVSRVVPGSPAAKAGIKPEDKVLSVANRQTPDWQSVTKAISDNAGKSVPVEVERGDRKIRLDAHLRTDSEKGLLGIVTKLVRRPRRPAEALTESVRFSYQATGTILSIMGKLVLSPGSVVGQLRSPIGVVQETAPIAQRDLLEYTVTLAGISIAIGIFNFLPIPPLDGGRIFISGIEFVSRRRLKKESLIMINAVGVSLLLLLMTFVIVADIFRMTVLK